MDICSIYMYVFYICIGIYYYILKVRYLQRVLRRIYIIMRYTRKLKCLWGLNCQQNLYNIRQRQLLIYSYMCLFDDVSSYKYKHASFIWSFNMQQTCVYMYTTYIPTWLAIYSSFALFGKIGGVRAVSKVYLFIYIYMYVVYTKMPFSHLRVCHKSNRYIS